MRRAAGADSPQAAGAEAGEGVLQDAGRRSAEGNPGSSRKATPSGASTLPSARSRGADAHRVHFGVLRGRRQTVAAILRPGAGCRTGLNSSQRCRQS